MKKILMIISLLFGLTNAGYTLASTGEVLQPVDNISASVNQGVFDTIKIGNVESGGVTYFNGSIVNEGAAVTIADDLRVDGAIYRSTQKDSGTPVKIYDDVSITGSISANSYYGISDEDIPSAITVNILQSLSDYSEIGGSSSPFGSGYIDTLTVRSLEPQDILSSVGRSYDRFNWGYFDYLYANYFQYSLTATPTSDNPESLAPVDKNGDIRECTSERYGQMIFSDKGINGDLPNEFYGCTGRGWVQL